MGGAGAWHIGAHYADQWACVHTGAGFVDVKRYQKLTPDKMPPWYEQKLWGVYDVPDYARNFFNVPLISYSGEIDTQRDSAEYMMEVLAQGRPASAASHRPGHGAQVSPGDDQGGAALHRGGGGEGAGPLPGRSPHSDQDAVLRPHEMDEPPRHGGKLEGGAARRRGSWTADTIEIKTQNVSRIVFYPPPQMRQGDGSLKVKVDGASLDLAVGAPLPQFETMSNPGPRTPETTAKITAALCRLIKENGKWRDFGSARRFSTTARREASPRRIPAPCDACVHEALPGGAAGRQVGFARPWMPGSNAESAHFITRWKGLMRGDRSRGEGVGDPRCDRGRQDAESHSLGHAGIKPVHQAACALAALAMGRSESGSWAAQSFDAKTPRSRADLSLSQVAGV